MLVKRLSNTQCTMRQSSTAAYLRMIFRHLLFLWSTRPRFRPVSGVILAAPTVGLKSESSCVTFIVSRGGTCPRQKVHWSSVRRLQPSPSALVAGRDHPCLPLLRRGRGHYVFCFRCCWPISLIRQLSFSNGFRIPRAVGSLHHGSYPDSVYRCRRLCSLRPLQRLCR